MLLSDGSYQLKGQVDASHDLSIIAYMALYSVTHTQIANLRYPAQKNAG